MQARMLIRKSSCKNGASKKTQCIIYVFSIVFKSKMQNVYGAIFML